MRLSCTCGVFIGFILAMVLSGAAYYFFYLRKNPEVSAKGFQHVQETWQHAKESGDNVIEAIKPFAQPSAEDTASADMSHDVQQPKQETSK